MSQELFDQFGWRLTLEEAELPDGRKKKAVIAARCDSVHILAFPDPDHLLVLREFRPFYGTFVWMLPSGKVDKETDSAEAAQRELQEETGFRAGSLKYLWTVYHSESFRCANHVFRADGLLSDPLPQDAHELIEVHTFSPVEALDRILGSQNVHMPSAYAVLRFLRESKKT